MENLISLHWGRSTVENADHTVSLNEAEQNNDRPLLPKISNVSQLLPSFCISKYEQVHILSILPWCKKMIDLDEPFNSEVFKWSLT